MLPDDDTLPFDELDPCCQKEILNKKRQKEVKSKLRTVDRSNQRWDAGNSVFTKVNFGWKCICCEENKGYDALLRFKASIPESDTPVMKDSISSLYKDSGEDDSEDDLDELLNDFNIPITVYEVERIQRVQKRLCDEELATQYGLNKHVEDSPVHIQQYVDQSNHIPLILHIYQSDSIQSAKVDYLLESKICRLYLGSRFRRIALSTLRLAGSSNPSHPWITDSLLERKGNILCFQAKKLAYSFDRLEELGEHIDDVERNLLRHLHNTHCLREELPGSELLQMLSRELGMKSSETEEAEEEDRYCDDPGCVKQYPHEHVGKASNSASFARVKQEGMEALASNTFLRL